MMLLWALLFLVVAIITAVLGFSGVAVAISFMSKVLFFISLIFFLVFFILVIVQKLEKHEDEKKP